MNRTFTSPLLVHLCAALAMCAMILCAGPAQAQFDSAQVSGVVQDTTGAVLPGVDVTLTNTGTSQERRTVTNEAGIYMFPNTPVGTYTVTATLAGFKGFSQTGVQVNAGVNIRVDVGLAVGAVSETVLVEGSPAIIDTAVLARTVSAEQLAETPLSGRRAAMVAQLSAGVMGGNMGSFGTGLTSFSTNITSINGGRTDEFMTTVDGAPSIRVRAAGGFTMGAQNFDTVEEVQVLTTNYQAEYGRSSAGQVRLVTKSGSREFRGNAFWGFQNDALDANTWSRNRAGLPKNPHQFNSGGFTLGGPLYIPGAFNNDKQKLFFFWGEEWTRDRATEPQMATVPSLAMRNGDFSELLSPSNRFFTGARIIKDPRTGLPFANNVIPKDRISPIGQALLNAYPLPTPGFQSGTQNWIGAPPVFNNQRKDSIKIDWVVNSNHRLAVRHTWAPNIWNDPEAMGIYSTVWDYPGRTMAATFTSTLSSSLLNEFTFSWGSTYPSRFLGQRTCDYCPGGADAFLYPQASALGINYPQLFPGTKLDPEKLPDVVLQGFTTIDNGAYPGSWNDFVFLWADNVTKIRGNHTFKSGISIERSGMNDKIQLTFAAAPATRNQNGQFRFLDPRAGGTGLSAANAILGLFDDYSEFGNKPDTHWVAMGYDGFFQDSWRTSRDLTLELGLRYSVWQPWGAKNNELASFNAQFYDPARAAVINPTGGFVVSGDRFNGIVLPGDRPTADALRDFPQLAGLQQLYHGLPNGFSRTFKDGFQPRLGLAYAMNEKTTFRAGVGNFLNRVQINTTAAYGFNPPLSEMQTVINGNADAPGGAQTRNFPLVMAMQDPDFRNPSSWAWNTTVDRELPGTMRAQISYVGRQAHHLERGRNINQLQPGTIQANPGINANALRPYKGFGSITLYETTGRSAYNALQVQVDKRSLSRNIGFSVAYTLSRTKDDGNGRGDILPNAYDDSTYYGLSDFDRTHVFVSQFTYRLPRLEASPAALRSVFGLWDISGIFQAQSGIPIDVRSLSDFAGVGPGSGQQFLDVVGDPFSVRTEFDGTRAIWFDKNAFRNPAPGIFGNQAQNTLRLPGFWDLNLSLRKSIPLGGARRVEFRWVAFNVLNHTRLNDGAFGNNVNNPNSGDFGSITTKVGNRTMQVGMQYIF